ncbi:hypothetical protein JCM10003_1094 [Bacteroides pyogenes JCM 10003]|nr:hypothetical protein JCM10003_1094 [Bacteroides pyogenes JCM 10003]
MSRLLIHIPVISRSFRRVRSPSPQSFLIESNSFGLHRTQNVCSQAAVTDWQRPRFPSRIRIPRSVSGGLRFIFSLPHVGTPAVPDGSSFQSIRFVEPNGIISRMLTGPKRA